MAGSGNRRVAAGSLTTGVLAAVLALTPAADAAWERTGTGTAAARGGTVAGVGSVTADGTACTGNNRASATVRWPAVAGATAYRVQWSTDSTFPRTATSETTTTAPTATVQQNAVNKTTTLHVRVRAEQHSWVGGYQNSTGITVGPC